MILFMFFAMEAMLGILLKFSISCTTTPSLSSNCKKKCLSGVPINFFVLADTLDLNGQER